MRRIPATLMLLVFVQTAWESLPAATQPEFVTGLEIVYSTNKLYTVHDAATNTMLQTNYCLAAEEDPAGNWGWASEGMQMSLRFFKSTFRPGEAVVATILVRNISPQPRRYSRWGTPLESFKLLVLDDQNARVSDLESKAALASGKSDFQIRLSHIISNPMPLLLEPLTQNAHRFRLEEFYDLSRPGRYFVRASCTMPTLDDSGWGTVESGTATFVVQNENPLPTNDAQPPSIRPAPQSAAVTQAAHTAAPSALPPSATRGTNMPAQPSTTERKTDESAPPSATTGQAARPGRRWDTVDTVFTVVVLSIVAMLAAAFQRHRTRRKSDHTR